MKPSRRVPAALACIALILFGPALRSASAAPSAPAQAHGLSPRVEVDSVLAAALTAVPAVESGLPMDADVFARIALIASGADPEVVDTGVARLRSLAEELRASLPAGADEWTRGDAALRFLYARVLSRYSEFQTRVDTALDAGTYNCVSSAILYHYFARAVGLESEGVETPVHAFCTVVVNGKKLDVETTNPYGFDPGTKRELPGSRANETRYAIVPKANYLKRKPVNERRLLAMVYVNRSSALEKEGSNAEAVAISLDSWALQGTEAARGDLAERNINYAAFLSRQAGGGERALDFIAEAERRWGTYPRYREFAAATVGSALNALMDKGAYAEGFTLLESRSPLLEASWLKSMRGLVSANYLGSFASSRPLGEALAEIARYRDYLSEADRARAISFAYGRSAEELARQGKWLEAAAVLDSGLTELPGRPELARARSAYRQNYAVEIHNRAAAAYNSGDAAGARAIVEEGLRFVPDSPVLKSDLSRF